MMVYPGVKLAAFFGLPVCVGWLLLVAWRRRRRLVIKDKVVLITGANSGLGEACGHLFFRSGCKVILTGRRREELERVKGEMLAYKENNGNSHLHTPELVVFDLCDGKSLASGMSSALSIHGAIDILVNNAGVSFRGDIDNTHLDVFRRVMEVNYFAQVAVTKALLPMMVKQAHGTIVFVSSVQGKISIPYRSAYSASKHAIQAFGDCLRAEMSDSGVHVCVLSPGYIRTKMSLNAVTADGSLHGVMDSATASGMSAEEAARQIQQAIIYRLNDVVLSPLLIKLAIYLRNLMPSVIFWIAARRARKQKSLLKKDK